MATLEKVGMKVGFGVGVAGGLLRGEGMGKE